MRYLIVLLMAVLCLNAQDRFSSSVVDTDPAPIPATATALFSFTVYVEEITLTNKTGSDVTCSIVDRQSTPRELFTGVVNAGSVYVMAFKGRKMPGGITWSCTNGTAVIGYVYGRRG